MPFILIVRYEYFGYVKSFKYLGRLASSAFLYETLFMPRRKFEAADRPKAL